MVVCVFNQNHTHNLAWFASRLENSLGYINTERLMAHSVLSDTASRYFKPDIDVIYKLYYQNMDLVTVMGKVEVHDDIDVDIQEIKEENIRLREDVEILKALERRRQQLD